MAAIIGSLERFGQAEPLVVQANTLRVIGGNGRLLAMQSLGWKECDIVEVDVDDNSATALGIALNRTGELATWKDDQLLSLLESLQAEDSLVGIGFSHADLEQLRELTAEQEAAVDLADVNIQPPPQMVWTLIGIPLHKFPVIAEDVERIARIDGALVEVSGSDIGGK